jgi:hypothetical protein
MNGIRIVLHRWRGWMMERGLLKNGAFEFWRKRHLLLVQYWCDWMTKGRRRSCGYPWSSVLDLSRLLSTSGKIQNLERSELSYANPITQVLLSTGGPHVPFPEPRRPSLLNPCRPPLYLLELFRIRTASLKDWKIRNVDTSKVAVAIANLNISQLHYSNRRIRKVQIRSPKQRDSEALLQL